MIWYYTCTLLLIYIYLFVSYRTTIQKIGCLIKIIIINDRNINITSTVPRKKITSTKNTRVKMTFEVGFISDL